VFREKARSPGAQGRIVSVDEVATASPDLIIGSWCGKKFVPGQVASRPGLSEVAAVRNKAMYEIKSSLILQPGPAALTDGLCELHRTIALSAGS
jgi:iron complex transport system substrate-binding protein